MRSGRSHYSSAPASSSRVLNQKPKPRKPKQEWNQLLLVIFFVILPIFGVLSVFLAPLRWIFIILTILSVIFMWLVQGFLAPGRLLISAVYGLMLVFTLISALSTGSKPGRIDGQTSFLTPVPMASPTPAFNYSVMGTNVPDDFYGFGGDGEEEEDFGTGDYTISTGDVEPSTGAYTPLYKSDAEIALENFMEKWRKGIIADMVQYTSRAWQDAQNESASQTLFWKFGQKPLEDWRQMAAPSGTDANDTRTIRVQADIEYGGALKTYEYDAIVVNENGVWLVDPASLSAGELVIAATATPDPNITPTPSPEPTNTPIPSSKTKLYYNKKGGGKYYHAEAECASVAKKWLPLSSFTYGQLNDSPYNKLQPCTKCNPPLRP